ncbi:GNAT family N-acetyltransferase [Chloroflexota bacterium]
MTEEAKIKIRPMSVSDLDAIVAVDREIRWLGKAITYAHITTEEIITATKQFSQTAHPESYEEFITRDMSGEIEYGFVAEVNGEIQGFIIGHIVGKVPHTEDKLGEILVVGVYPKNWRRGIASLLVRYLFEAFRAKDVRQVRMQVDESDKYLMGFCERIGFKSQESIEYVISL